MYIHIVKLKIKDSDPFHFQSCTSVLLLQWVPCLLAGKQAKYYNVLVPLYRPALRDAKETEKLQFMFMLLV